MRKIAEQTFLSVEQFWTENCLRLKAKYRLKSVLRPLIILTALTSCTTVRTTSLEQATLPNIIIQELHFGYPDTPEQLLEKIRIEANSVLTEAEYLTFVYDFPEVIERQQEPEFYVWLSPIGGNIRDVTLRDSLLTICTYFAIDSVVSEDGRSFFFSVPKGIEDQWIEKVNKHTYRKPADPFGFGP